MWNEHINRMQGDRIVKIVRNQYPREKVLAVPEKDEKIACEVEDLFETD